MISCVLPPGVPSSKGHPRLHVVDADVFISRIKETMPSMTVGRELGAPQNQVR